MARSSHSGRVEMGKGDVVELEGDIELIEKLTQLLLIDPDGVKEALKAGGEMVRDEAKANVRRRGLVKSGELERSITMNVRPQLNVVIGTPLGWRAKIHEYGGIITPKRARFLQFKVGGEWKKVRRVTMPARPFLRTALLDNAERVVRKIGDVLIVKIREKVGA